MTVLPAPIAPTADGSAIATIHVTAWRLLAAEVAYQRSVVAVGGPLLFSALVGASALGNRRRRRQAAWLAMPRWRPLGDVLVLVAEARLLVLHQGSWASVWFDAITAVESNPDATLTLQFADDPPYGFTGTGAAHLAGVLTEALAARRALTVPFHAGAPR